MIPVHLLFLGASRLVGLLERFHTAARDLDVHLEVSSFEDDKPWHAIGAAGLARIVAAPSFQAAEFTSRLLEFIERERIDVVIPCIDRATVALARVAPMLTERAVLPLCASAEICETMADKRSADALFRQLGFAVPSGEGFPLLAKPRFGSSSRGIARLNDEAELAFWKQRNRVDDFLLQGWISGTEYSLDAYVDARRRVAGIVSRVRVATNEGEVTVTRTRRNPGAIAVATRLLEWGDWHGPATIQVIDDGTQPWLLECNPRFGSGVTCSIEAGLAIPEWILRERLGLPLPESPPIWRDDLCMTRSRKDHFLWL